MLHAVLSFCMLAISCQTVPITGREQLQLVSSEQVRTMSFDAYRDFLSKNEVIRGTSEAEQVIEWGEEFRRRLRGISRSEICPIV